MTNIESIVSTALSQDGDRYVFGAEVSPSDSNPEAFDCSELVQWACAREGLSPTMPDGSWIQWRHCRNYGRLITVEQAVNVRGALLFSFRGDPASGGRPRGAHVAISLGNGQTIEARSTRWGVGIFTAHNRGWTHAALIPGASYEGGRPMLGVGSSGINVQKWQNLLNRHLERYPQRTVTGELLQPIAEDGVFGERTRERTLTFQGFSDIDTTGVVTGFDVGIMAVAIGPDTGE